MSSLLELDPNVEHTRAYARRKYHRCPKCRSTPNTHEVRHYMAATRDGMVFCTWCDTYIGIWDTRTETLIYDKDRYK